MLPLCTPRIVSWLATLRHEAADVPTTHEMMAKIDGLKRVRLHEVTDAEIDYMLNEKKKVRSKRKSAHAPCRTSQRLTRGLALSPLVRSLSS